MGKCKCPHLSCRGYISSSLGGGSKDQRVCPCVNTAENTQEGLKQASPCADKNSCLIFSAETNLAACLLWSCEKTVHVVLISSLMHQSGYAIN